MPRGRAKEPGIKALPGVPYRSDEVGPNMRDVDTERGALCYVPREPINRCMAFSDETTGRGSLASPASATFTAGSPTTVQSLKDRRVLPENQLPGSLNTQAGLGTPKRTQQPAKDAHEAIERA